jgi:O-antigen/teichoic acid export membrane protein
LEDRIQKLVTGAGQGLAGAVGGRFLSFLSSILAARILGPAAFGLYSIGWTLLRFFALIAPLGMEKGVLRFAPKYYGKDEAAHKGLILQAHAIAVVSGTLFGATLFILAPWLAGAVYAKPDLEPVFRLFALAFPAIVLLVVVAAATRTTQRVGYSVLIHDLGQPLLGLTLMLLFYLLGLHLVGVILSDILSLGIAAAAGLWVVIRLFPALRARAIRPVFTGSQLLGFSLPASFAAAFVVYIFWIDRVFVGYFRTSGETGIYQAASQISTLFSVVLAGINLIVIPMFANAHARGDRAGLQDIYRIGTKWGIYFCIPVLIVLFASPAEVLTFFFGAGYAGGADVLVILLIGQLINLLTGSVNPLIVMTGNQNYLFRLSGVVLVLDVALNLMLIPRYGLMGAASTTVFSLGGVFIVAVLWVKRKLGLWPYDRRYLKGLVAAGITLVSVLSLETAIPHASAVLKLVLQGSVAAIVFMLLLVVQKLEVEDRAFVTLVWKRITRRE